MDVTGAETLPGPDEADPIEIELENDGAVRLVRVHRLGDDERSPDGLARALTRAHTAALSARLAPTEARDDAAPRTRSGPPVVSGPGPRPVPPSYGTASLEEVRTMFAGLRERPRRVASFGPRTRTGRSDNDCVTVRVSGAVRMAELEVDPGWLGHASRTQVEAALNQAYERLAGATTEEATA